MEILVGECSLYSNYLVQSPHSDSAPGSNRLFLKNSLTNCEYVMYDSIVFLSRRLVSDNTGSVRLRRNSCDREVVFLFLSR